VHKTNAHTWIHIDDLACKYWRPTILFEIVGALSIPLALYEPLRIGLQSLYKGTNKY